MNCSFTRCLESFTGWYRQYDAHKDDFIERYDKSTEEWLFHGELFILYSLVLFRLLKTTGCRRAESAEAIIRDCFNRSHAVNCGK